MFLQRYSYKTSKPQHSHIATKSPNHIATKSPNHIATNSLDHIATISPLCHKNPYIATISPISHHFSYLATTFPCTLPLHPHQTTTSLSSHHIPTLPQHPTYTSHSHLSYLAIPRRTPLGHFTDPFYSGRMASSPLLR